jgi:hypothetical protein
VSSVGRRSTAASRSSKLAESLFLPFAAEQADGRKLEMGSIRGGEPEFEQAVAGGLERRGQGERGLIVIFLCVPTAGITRPRICTYPFRTKQEKYTTKSWRRVKLHGESPKIVLKDTNT